MPDSGVATVATGAGMRALWRGSAFADVDGHDAWETRVNERLAEAIESGELVPVGMQSDGAYGVRVAVAPNAPTEREATRTVVTSRPYRLVADGGPVWLSGVEAVGDGQSSPVGLSLPEGRSRTPSTRRTEPLASRGSAAIRAQAEIRAMADHGP